MSTTIRAIGALFTNRVEGVFYEVQAHKKWVKKRGELETEASVSAQHTHRSLLLTFPYRPRRSPGTAGG
jgi:hypothetical protein